jgi:hypothetical protein
MKIFVAQNQGVISGTLPSLYSAGLIKAIQTRWRASDRQCCCVQRARNLYSKLPEHERERVKHAYWQALDDAINANVPLAAPTPELQRPLNRRNGRCVLQSKRPLVGRAFSTAAATLRAASAGTGSLGTPAGPKPEPGS